MKDLRSPRRLIRIWHRREKATIDHLVRALGDPKSSTGAAHSAFTPSGLAVEEQVRKAWCPSCTGLPVF